jgi:ribonuclease Z
MTFEVTILGSSSATPTSERHPSAQVLNVNEQYFLIDCGEGTQMQLNRYKAKAHKINHIFISHLHGDHYFGLIGLISTMHLQGRIEPLYIYGPADLQQVIELQLHVSQSVLKYELIFNAIENDVSKVIYENESIEVSTIILSHRVPCTGFLFREKKYPRKLIKDKVIGLGIHYTNLMALKEGKDYVMDGTIIKNEELTTASNAPRAYAYCSDTIYMENIVDIIKEVDVLYHESTFMHDMLPRAQETYHSTSLQAATIAQKANVTKLLIGHFSARYKTLDAMLTEAKSVFENTHLAVEGEKFEI